MYRNRAGPLLVGFLAEMAFVDRQGTGKGGNGGEQPLLKVRDQKRGCGLDVFVGDAEAFPAESIILVEEFGQQEVGRIRGEAAEVDLDDFAFREATLDLAQVFVETADHDVGEILLRWLSAANKSLGVEQLEQCGEAAGVAVVGRGGEE